MIKSKIFLASMLILSWLSVPFLGKKAFRKYYPSAIFIVILTKILDIYGKKKKWWRFYKGIPPLDSMDFFNFGPYFVSSLWMLKMTYGKFFVYLISNITLHFVFIYMGLRYVKNLKILSLVNLTKFQYLIIDFIRALLLYGFQKVVDRMRPENQKLS